MLFVQYLGVTSHLVAVYCYIAVGCGLKVQFSTLLIAPSPTHPWCRLLSEVQQTWTSQPERAVKHYWRCSSYSLTETMYVTYSLTETMYVDYSRCLNATHLILQVQQDKTNTRDYLKVQCDPGLVDSHYSCRGWWLSTFSDITSIKPFCMSHFRTFRGI